MTNGSSETGSTRRRYWILALKLAVSAALIYLLFRFIHIGDFLQVAAAMDPVFLAAGFAAAVGIIFLEVCRFNTIFHDYGVSFPRWIRIYLVGQFYGAFMPGSIGADLYSVAVLKRRRSDVVQTVSHVLALRVFGLASILLVILVILIAAPARAAEPVARLAATVAGLDLPSAWLALIAGFAGVSVMAALLPRVRARVISLSLKMKDSVVSIPLSRAGAISAASVAIVVVRGVMFYFVIASVAPPVSFEAALMTAAFANLSWLLPISFSGIGVREGVIVAMLAAYGVQTESALLVAVATRLYLMLTSLAGGGAALFWPSDSIKLTLWRKRPQAH